MNKKLLAITCAIGIIALLATAGCSIGGNLNVATITTVTNGESMGTTKGRLNANFTNINSEVIADTTAIGTLSGLTTTNKSNLVSAINEVDSHADAAIASDALKVTKGYGGIYVASGLTSITGSGTTLTKVTTAVASTAMPLSGFTHSSNGRLRCDVAGTYLVSFHITIKCGVIARALIGIYINDTYQDVGQKDGTTQLEFGEMFSGNAILSLAANDILAIGVRNENLDGHTLWVATYDLTANRVD